MDRFNAGFASPSPGRPGRPRAYRLLVYDAPHVLFCPPSPGLSHEHWDPGPSKQQRLTDLVCESRDGKRAGASTISNRMLPSSTTTPSVWKMACRVQECSGWLDRAPRKPQKQWSKTNLASHTHPAKAMQIQMRGQTKGSLTGPARTRTKCNMGVVPLPAAQFAQPAAAGEVTCLALYRPALSLLRCTARVWGVTTCMGSKGKVALD